MHHEDTTSAHSSQPTRVDPYQETPLGVPDVLQQIQQRQVLARAHPKHPLPERGSRSGPPKQTWFRPGAKRVREGETGLRILTAAEWVATRRGRPWTCNDQTANDALGSRCFDYEYIETRKMEPTRPSWLEPLCEDQWFVDDGPGFPTKGGFLKFITDLLHARRVGAIGVVLSQADAGTLYKVSPRHWRRWMAHAEDLGMVRILQLWQKCPKVDRHRGHWKMCYMLGNSIIERAGIALYEGLDRTFDDGRPMKPAAAAAAKRLRRVRKEASYRRHEELWQESRSWSTRGKRTNPTSLSPDMKSGPTLQSRETGDYVHQVSPEGEIQITSADGASEIVSNVVHGKGEGNPASAGAPLASLARLDARPTASAVQTANNPDRGASRIERANHASSIETTFSEETNDMLAKLMANLRGPMMAFLFFLVSTTFGCRYNPDTSYNDTTGETSPDAIPAGTGSTGGGSTSGGGGADNSNKTSDMSVSDDETSTETGGTYPWEDDLLSDPCVAACYTSELAEARAWCETTDDIVFCTIMAKDAVLLRCGQECGCVAYCEE